LHETLALSTRLIETGALAQAEARLESAVATWPTSPQAHRLLGSALGMLGKLDTAREALERALVLEPDNSLCLADLANVYRLQKRHAQAEVYYRRSLALAPDNREVRCNLVLLELEVGREPCTIEALDDLLLPPAHPAALRALVRSLDSRGRVSEAIASCEAVLRSEPDHACAHAAIGFLLLKREFDPAAALLHLDRALAADRNDAETHANRAIALQDLGRMDEAFESYDTALTLDASLHAVRFHRALGLLLMGRYAEAWPDYELRFKGEGRALVPVERPVWRGEPLAQRSLLIYGEQGIGDEIMFASCVPELMRQSRQLLILCTPKLASLFRRSFPGTICLGHPSPSGAPAPELTPGPDLMVAMGSLPLRFRCAEADFPRHSGYLRADPERVDHYRRRLDALSTRPKVGLSWRGGTQRSRRELRTLPEAELAALFEVANVEFVNLQYDSDGTEPEIAAARIAGRLHHWPDALDDYDRTAALVCALDLVVSVCTALIHLAGALGRPVWIMAPHVPEWRYGLRGEGMPWYPTARVFRQPSRGDWSSVTHAVVEQLRSLTP
jgi:tetratricopeptide (TPR) repeat protein